MNRRDKQRKLEQRRAHNRTQKTKLKETLHDATCLGKGGQPLKKPRTGEALKNAMERHGYVPNGKGGWRRIRESQLGGRR